MIITPNIRRNGDLITQTQKPKSLSSSLASISTWIHHLDPLLHSKLSKTNKQEAEPNNSLIILDTNLTQATLIQPKESITRDRSTKDIQVLSYLVPVMESLREFNTELQSGTTDVRELKQKYDELKAQLDKKSTSIENISKSPAFVTLYSELEAIEKIYNFNSISQNPLTETIEGIVQRTPITDEKSAEIVYEKLLKEFEPKLYSTADGLFCTAVLNIVRNKFLHYSKQQSPGEQLSYTMHTDMKLVKSIKKFLESEDNKLEVLVYDLFDAVDTAFAGSKNAVKDLFLSKLYIVRNVISTVYLEKLPLDQLIPLKNYLFKEFNSTIDPQFQELIISELANTELNEQEILQLLNRLLSDEFLTSGIERQALGILYKKLKTINPESKFIEDQEKARLTLQQEMESFTYEDMVKQITNPNPELRLKVWKVIEPINNSQFDRLGNSKIGFEVEFQPINQVRHRPATDSYEEQHDDFSHQNTAVVDDRMEVSEDPYGATEVRRKPEYLEYNPEYVDDVVQTLHDIRLSNSSSVKGNTRLHPIHITLDSTKHPRPLKIYDGIDNRRRKDAHESRGHGDNSFASPLNTANSIALMALCSSQDNDTNVDLDFNVKNLLGIDLTKIVFLEYLKQTKPEDFALFYNVFVNASQGKNKTFMGYPDVEKIIGKYFDESQFKDSETLYNIIDSINDPMLVDSYSGLKKFTIRPNKSDDPIVKIIYDGKLLQAGFSYYNAGSYAYQALDESGNKYIVLINSENRKSVVIKVDTEGYDKFQEGEFLDVKSFFVITKDGKYQVYDSNLDLIMNENLIDEKISYISTFKIQNGIGFKVRLDDGTYKIKSNEKQELADLETYTSVYAKSMDYDYSIFELTNANGCKAYIPKFDVTIDDISEGSIEGMEDGLFYKNTEGDQYFYSGPTGITYGPFDKVIEFNELSILKSKVTNKYQIFDTFGPISMSNGGLGESMEFDDFVKNNSRFAIFKNNNGNQVAVNYNGTMVVEEAAKIDTRGYDLFYVKDGVVEVRGGTEYDLEGAVDFEIHNFVCILINSEGKKKVVFPKRVEIESRWVDEIEFESYDNKYNCIYKETNEGKIRLVSYGTSEIYEPQGVVEKAGELYIDRLKDGRIKVITFESVFRDLGNFKSVSQIEGIKDLIVVQDKDSLTYNLINRYGDTMKSGFTSIESRVSKNAQGRDYLILTNIDGTIVILNEEGYNIASKVKSIVREEGFCDIANGEGGKMLIMQFQSRYKDIRPFKSNNGEPKYVAYDGETMRVLDFEGDVEVAYYLDEIDKEINFEDLPFKEDRLPNFENPNNLINIKYTSESDLNYNIKLNTHLDQKLINKILYEPQLMEKRFECAISRYNSIIE